MTKPITLYGHASGPNPWKVAIILEELGVPYTQKIMDMADLKKPPFEKINVNGRVPAIEDPNTGITLWESGAIIEYLQEKYDAANALSYAAPAPERYLVKQWLHFQMSGQGPYFGQAAWFNKFHPETVPSAIERYNAQITRVLQVIDNHLRTTGKEYLVGDKVTIADLAFVTWDMVVPWIMGDKTPNIEKDYPLYFAWHQRLMKRPAVAKVAKDKEAAMAAGH
ncbi:hypothetical protein LZ554_002111 [Drepanopeziza brunnea f. sp. 'monogermtubi']|nr:hypothetical protein LZ554_002111 [Drepanopeziza brunnea f. sp. 'monogermtubi']